VGNRPDGAGDLRHGHAKGEVSYTPRNVLKKVVEAYTERGWKPVVAPEIEFYLVAQSDDPDYPLKPPGGARAGRSPAGSPIRSPASTSSTSWSTTSTISPTSRGWRSTR
jgi:glutamine synthetase